MHKKTIILVATVIAVAVIAMVIYALIPRSHILLKIAPTDATLSVDNGKEFAVSRGHEISVKPGEHTLKLSRDEFSTETVTVSVQNGETKTVMIALTPQTDGARAILNADPDSVAIYEGYVAGKVRSKMAQTEAENPAYKKLPINTQEYFVYTCLSLKHPDDATKRAICIDLSVEAAKEDALIALDKVGIDIDKEEVYIGTDAKVRPIIRTSDYTVDYYHDIGANGKPTFVIIVLEKAGMNTNGLIKQKDIALSTLKNDGYQLNKVNIVYVNHDLVQFNSSPDVSFPVIGH